MFLYFLYFACKKKNYKNPKLGINKSKTHVLFRDLGKEESEYFKHLPQLVTLKGKN